MNIPTLARARFLVKDLRNAADLDDLLHRVQELERLKAHIERIKNFRFYQEDWENEVGFKDSMFPDFTDNLPWRMEDWVYAFDDTRMLVKKSGHWMIYPRTDLES